MRGILAAAALAALVSPGAFYVLGTVGGSIFTAGMVAILLAVLWDAHKTTTRF